MFSDMTDHEFMSIYTNKHMTHRPRVGAIQQERYEEDLESAKEDGLDIGDYKWIDDNLYHCPMVDWVKTG